MDGSSDRYSDDVLSTDWKRPPNGRTTDVGAELGLVLEDPSNDFVGEIVSIDRDSMVLEDRFGKRRSYPYGPGFWLDGKPVAVTRRLSNGPGGAGRSGAGRTGSRRTASGSVAVENVRARVARESRIYVEGRHDAELVEKVWGDDLRIEGVVVEYLEGIDDLPGIVADFDPAEGRRLGVLVDHLVTGSKESRLASTVENHPHVLVVGHPYVDIWQAVRPERLGLPEWPTIPRNVPWKHGICDALGWPHDDQADIAAAWKRILGTVRNYRDLEPSLLGRIEQLIDFVTT